MFASRENKTGISRGAPSSGHLNPMRMTSFFQKRPMTKFLRRLRLFGFFAPKPWNLGLQEFTCFNDLDRKQLYLAGPLDGCQVLLQILVSALALWRIFLLHKMTVIEDTWKYCTHLDLYYIYIYIYIYVR